LHDFKGGIPGGVTVVPGRSGSFEVTWNGELIFSKYALDRFPDPLEVETLVAHKLGVPPPQADDAPAPAASG
jgi:predicted Rdx family selenoprotein